MLRDPTLEHDLRGHQHSFGDIEKRWDETCLKWMGYGWGCDKQAKHTNVVVLQTSYNASMIHLSLTWDVPYLQGLWRWFKTQRENDIMQAGNLWWTVAPSRCGALQGPRSLTLTRPYRTDRLSHPLFKIYCVILWSEWSTIYVSLISGLRSMPWIERTWSQRSFWPFSYLNWS